MHPYRMESNEKFSCHMAKLGPTFGKRGKHLAGISAVTAIVKGE